MCRSALRTPAQAEEGAGHRGKESCRVGEGSRFRCHIHQDSSPCPAGRGHCKGWVGPPLPHTEETPGFQEVERSASSQMCPNDSLSDKNNNKYHSATIQKKIIL